MIDREVVYFVVWKLEEEVEWVCEIGGELLIVVELMDMGLMGYEW